jgi:hypothetical protein
MWSESKRGLARRVFLAAAGTVVAGLAMPAMGLAAAPSCLVAAGGQIASTAPLRFGIYPGGPAGSISPKSPPRAEDPTARLNALRTLAGSSPFVVRLYSSWTGNASADDVSGWLDSEIAGYTAAGLQVELVVRYKPGAAGAASAPSAFAAHVRAIVNRYGRDPGFVSLQVTNEANLPGAPDASDGAFPGAARAVVDGVIGAKDQARRSGYGQLGIGFSWAYDERPQAAADFWKTLGRLGGPAFADAVDWVGIDTYPGTWTPQISLSNVLPGQAGTAVRESVRSVRDCFMPMAGLGAHTTIHIAENGFPTGPGRSDALQSQVLDAMVTSVDAIRGTYGVTDYRWFDLRDSSSADPSLESQYGITRDDYSPKPAFATYRSLIARYSRAASTVPKRGTCRASRVKMSVPHLNSRRLSSLVVQVGGKVVGRVRSTRIKRAVRISMRSGRSTVRLKVRGKSDGRAVSRAQSRTFRIC